MKFFTIKDLTIRADLISHIKVKNPAPSGGVSAGEIYMLDGRSVFVDEATARELQIALDKSTRNTVI